MEILKDENPGVVAYKGFRADMTCRGVQYTVGEVTVDPNLSDEEYPLAGDCGLHAAVNPFDVFVMYPPTDGTVYAEVTVMGDVHTDSGCIVSGRRLRVNKMMSFEELVDAGIKYQQNNTTNTLAIVRTSGRCRYVQQAIIANTTDEDFVVAIDTTTGYGNAIACAEWSAFAYTVQNHKSAVAQATSGFAVTVGKGSDAYALDGVLMAATSGNDTVATNNFDSEYSHAQVATQGSVAVALRNGKARGPVGSWLVLGYSKSHDNVTAVKTVRVDGEQIKENTWYSLAADGVTLTEHGSEPAYV